MAAALDNPPSVPLHQRDWWLRGVGTWAEAKRPRPVSQGCHCPRLGVGPEGGSEGVGHHEDPGRQEWEQQARE